MKKVLFMGDSLTDAGRNRNISEPNIAMGAGYATIAAADIGFRNPGKHEFYNRGIGGHGIKDMYARIREDVIAIKPDYMSILASVNDAWFDLGGKGLPIIDGKKGMERFEKTYSLFIEETLDSLPDVKIMILEPFTLDAKKNPYGEEGAWAETYDIFRKGVEEKALVSRKIAEKYGFPFVELQAKFDAVQDPENPRMWLWDGVHPTCLGAHLIAQEWIKGFELMCH